MIHPTELESALNAIDSLSEHQAAATEALTFWHKRLRFALERYQDIEHDERHPLRTHHAASVRTALVRDQGTNRAIAQAASE